MMTQQRRIVFYILFILLIPAFLTGCGDYVRIDKRAMVLGIAIDSLSKDKIKVTLQIPNNPSPITGKSQETGGQGGGSQGDSGGGGSGGGSGGSLTLVTGVGKSFAQSYMVAQTKIDRNLFLGNLQVVVVSEELTEQQFKEVISELQRRETVDKRSMLMITKHTASSLLQVKAIQDEPSAMYLSNTMSSLRMKGYTANSQIWKFTRDLIGLGIDPMLSHIYVTNEGKIAINGVGVFQNTRFKGYLNRVKARGLFWVKGFVEDMPVEMGKGPTLTVVRIRRCNSKITWTKVKDTYVFRAKIRVQGFVMQDPSHGEINASEQTINHMQQTLKAKIRKECLQTFTQLQAWKSDVYGFGRFVLMRDPRDFRQENLKKRWHDEFAKSQLQLDVHVELNEKGEIG